MFWLSNFVSIRNKTLLSISILICLFSSTYLVSQELSVGLFYDDDYVNTCENSSCEAYTLKNFLESINYNVHTFEGTDSASLFDGLSCHEVFFLPESEAGDFANDINPNGGGEVIRDYVNTGGLMFIMGSDGLNQSSSNSAENINALFNLNIQNAAFTSSGYTYLNQGANISFLGSLPDSVRSFTTTNFIFGLPANAEIIYELEQDKVSVVEIPYGDGRIVYLGWSFFNGGPTGNQGPDNWSNLIQVLIREWADETQFPDCFSCDVEAPFRTVGNNIIRFLDADGNTSFDESDFEGSYDDNCGEYDISIVSDRELNCSNSYDQEIHLEVTDRVGNVLLDTFDVRLIDTVKPEFSSFPNDVTIECKFPEEAQEIDSTEQVITVNETLDLDSLDIYNYTFSTQVYPTGSVLDHVEFYINGSFNDLGELWIRVKDEFGNSSLLFNGNCEGQQDINTWFSDQGVDLDCGEITSGNIKFLSDNRDLNVFDNGPISPTYTFDIVNLGSLEGQVLSLGIKVFFTSDLSFPTIDEACSYSINYSDNDSRTTCPTGVIVRTFTVMDESGNSNQRNQIIRIEDTQEVEITYPDDYYIDCVNGINYQDSLLPEHLPPGFNEPIVFDDCREYHFNYSDRVVRSCGSHNIEIERTWVVQSDCEPTVQYQHKQNLAIIDEDAPVIDTVEPYVVFVDEVTCLSGGNFYFPSVDDLLIYDCSDNINVDMRVIDSFGVQFREDELMAGMYFVEISAVDPCGNRGIRLVPVELVDVSPPVIQCRTDIFEVPLNQLGNAQICGSILLTNVDENCSIKRYQMSFSPTFNNDDDDCLFIDCDDMGSTRTVYVRAEDISGNADVCTARIRVVDREAPQLLCSDIILPCNEPFDPLNYPFPSAMDNCDATPTVDCLPFRFIGNQCDSTYVRQCFTYDDDNNRSIPCDQFLTRIDTFSTSVFWPEEVVELNCGGDTGPANTGEPIIQSSCGLFTTTYTDNQFSLCGAANLFGIDRRWVVRNTCTNESFSFDQEVLVTDLDPPRFVFPTDSIFEVEIIDFDCETTVSITPEAIDDCTTGVTYSNSISGSSRELTGTFEIGDHAVVFYAEDLCGNVDSLEVIVRVTENKNPYVACESGLTFFMNQVGFVDLYPEDILDTAFDLCTEYEDLDFFISKVLPNGQDIGRQPKIRFECQDLGLNPVRLFARDNSKNISVCDVQVNVIDTFRLCPNGDFYDISGMIFNEDRIVIGGATAYINNVPLTGFDNGNNGDYLARALPRDSIYEIAIQKDTDHDNGVTALDLALIQQSQLRLRELGSPYRIIAADVNNDEKISVLDLIRIRSLLLGIVSEFPDVPSWRFVPESFEFINPLNPFENPIHYADTVLLGGESIQDFNFIGMKMGDVNNSAERFLTSNSTSDRAEYLDFDVLYRRIGESKIELSFELPTDWISGQMYVEFDRQLMQDITWNTEGMNADLYYFDDNKLHFVWNKYLEEELGSLSFIVDLYSPEELEKLIQLREDKKSLGAKTLWSEQEIALNFIEIKGDNSSKEECITIAPTLWSNGFRIVNRCGDKELKTMKIFNLSGQLFDELVLNSSESIDYDNPDLSTGLYLIQLEDENGIHLHFRTIKVN